MRSLLVVALSSLAMVVSSVPTPDRLPYQPYHNLSAEHAYDPYTEKCCRGTVFAKLPLADSSLQKCCGTKSIDSTLEMCCSGVVHQTKVGHVCCGITTYDPHSSLCCNGKVIPVPKEEIVNAFCCGDVYTCRKTHLCCGGRTVVQKKSGHDQCCGMSAAYNPESEICCLNFGSGLNVSQPVILKEGNKSSCCNGKAYDTKEQVCCASGLAPPGSSCCGNKTYDRQTQACCYSRLYNPDNQICCGGNLTDITNRGSQFKCCGTEAYDASKRRCQHYYGSRFEKPRFVEKTDAQDKVFCGEQSYNTTTQMCCDNEKVVAKPDEFADQCCGDKVHSWNNGTCCREGTESKYYEDRVSCCGIDKIDYKTQLCCGGKRQAKQSEKSYCCGDQQYDWSKEVCCGNEVQPTNGKMLSCCGMKHTYDSKTHICCGQNVIAKNKEGKSTCCSYSTTDEFQRPPYNY